MNVGSLAEFTSTVVYSQQGHIVVQVKRVVYLYNSFCVLMQWTYCLYIHFLVFLAQVVVSTVDIVSGNKQKTNVLTYIFRYVEQQLHTYSVVSHM